MMLRLLLGTLLGLPIVMAAPAQQFAHVDGVRVRYLVEGAGPKAIVLVHGWTCAGSFWRAQFADLLAAQYKVIAIDLPGHGGSDKPKIEYSVDLFARAIDAVMVHAKVPRAVVAGHSLGVPVVMQFIRDHPEKAQAFIAVDGAVWTQPRAANGKPSPFVESLKRAYAATAGAYIDTMFVYDTPDDLRNEIKQKMLATPAWVSISAIEMLGKSDVWLRGPTNVPTLAMMASKRPNDQRQAIHEQIFQRLEYVLWPEAGHFLMMEQPERFNRTVLDYLKRLGL
jgi:pimeloyl-ACP methyl ester carboxylesterase